MVLRSVQRAALVVLLLGTAVSPAVAAPPAAPPAADVCPPSDPDNGAAGPVGGSAKEYAACSNGRVYVMPCAPGLLWFPRAWACDYPQNAAAEPVPTATTPGEPARLDGRTGTVSNLNARVTWDDNPLYDAPVRFTAADGTALCTAPRTDQTGHATCTAEDVSLTPESLTADGYTATYEGTEILLGSSGRGAVAAAAG